MIIEKIKNLFFIFFILFLLLVSPVYSLDSREELFTDALNYTSNGDFNVALKKWDFYLDNFPNDPAALSNRGNVKLVFGDVDGSTVGATLGSTAQTKRIWKISAPC